LIGALGAARYLLCRSDFNDLEWRSPVLLNGISAARRSPLSLTVRPVVGRRSKITALGTYVPPEVITNQDLEKMVDTNDQWIMERTGIKERHRLAKGWA